MSACRLAVPVLAALTLTASIAAGVQVQPDFSGRWNADPAPAGRGRSGDMGVGWGPSIAVTQDSARLTVEYAFFGRGDMQPPLKFVYALDGAETTQTVMMGRGMQRQSSRAVWEADALVITTTHAFQDPATGKPSPAQVTHRLSLESPAALVVEVTRAGMLGGPASTVRTIYRRATS
jgi:hypothetical protein